MNTAGLLFPATVPVPEDRNTSRGATLAGPGLAAHGYDVISFFQGTPAVGSDRFALAYGGAAYRFTTQKNLDTFKADPSHYEPAYGGFCAYGTVLGKKFDGDPRYWKVVDNRLFLNLNSDIQSKWSEDIAGNIRKADENWAKLKSVAVEHL